MTRLSPLLSSALAIALFAVACSETAAPRPQALLFIDTNLASPRLLDRVRITVLFEVDGALVPACDGCVREVGIESAEDWPLSLGVERPADDTPRFVRATAFLAGRTEGGRIFEATAVDALARLRFDDTVVAQELFLDGACASIAAQPEARRSCRDGTLVDVVDTRLREPGAPSAVGTFRAEYGRTCATPARAESGIFDEAVCIPGGTFWMGDVRRQGLGESVDAVPEHLVTVSPFFIDRYEYSVARYRAAVAAGFVPTALPPADDRLDPKCSYRGPSDPSMDMLPLNCTPIPTAEELCAFEGGRLPSEAEWEWAAGSGPQERLFPWGLYRTEAETPLDGPDELASHAFDATGFGVLADGTDCDGACVFDMGWNVSEYMADWFHTYREPCWIPGNYGPDPVCDPPPEVMAHGRSARGGYWLNSFDQGAGLKPMTSYRQFFLPGGVASALGFRCVRRDGA